MCGRSGVWNIGTGAREGDCLPKRGVLENNRNAAGKLRSVRHSRQLFFFASKRNIRLIFAIKSNPAFEHVRFASIREEERAREFYGGLLGLDEIEKPGCSKKRRAMVPIADILHIGVEDTGGKLEAHPV